MRNIIVFFNYTVRWLLIILIIWILLILSIQISIILIQWIIIIWLIVVWLFWSTSGISSITTTKWITFPWPWAWFFPGWITILTIFAKTFCTFRISSFFEWISHEIKSIGWISAEELFDSKIFNILFNNLNTIIQWIQFSWNIWTSDTWWEFVMGPCVICLTFDLPSTHWSPS